MIDRSLRLLRDWAGFAERDWYDLPGRAGHGCYGTGYNNWGVQTNQKYLAAMATLSAYGDRIDKVDVGHVRSRALAALRSNLDAHVTGDGACTDGTRWGHTWISALGIERMMHGVDLLEAHLTDDDRAALRRVLISEADWLLNDYTKGGHGGPIGGLWNSSGRNEPESNIWNGAILWRAAMMYPDEAHAAEWRQRAHHFLVNGVSIPADAEDDTPIAGRPVREWHAGPNFFPNYALDHHGYLNVGYMVICVSNAAMLYFDLKRRKVEIPESLHHHQADLWQVLRRMIFADGRLARIGGDTRVRYAYCQEYLMPALLYAAEHLGDAHARGLLARQLDWVEREAATNGDGSFYSRRLHDDLARRSPYYTTRLESDRANALGMVAAYLAQADQAAPPQRDAAQAFEASAAGSWCEPEHGAALHRSPTRLASFAWRAMSLGQGLCQPPDDGHLAEWQHNLVGIARFMGDDLSITFAQSQHRKLGAFTIDTFDGGFITCGRIHEGANLSVAEGWGRKEPMAVHHIAFAALPDGHTVIGLQLVRMQDVRGFTIELKGLQLNIPNDLFNGHERRLMAAGGEHLLTSPVGREQVVDLRSRWANIDGRIGVVALYGESGLQVHRTPDRRGGKFHSLFVDQLCLGCSIRPTAHDADAVILDVGWAVAASIDADRTRRLADAHPAAAIAGLPALVRGVRVQGIDGRTYSILANFGDEETIATVDAKQVDLQPNQARIL